MALGMSGADCLMQQLRRSGNYLGIYLLFSYLRQRKSMKKQGAFNVVVVVFHNDNLKAPKPCELNLVIPCNANALAYIVNALAYIVNASACIVNASACIVNALAYIVNASAYIVNASACIVNASPCIVNASACIKNATLQHKTVRT